jgi:putative ABC transport system permease protein
MLRNYLKIAYRVLLRRKVFTCISLFAISFTLLVLMVSAAMLDHMFGPYAPETRLDRSLGVFVMRMSGPHSIWSGNPGYKFLDRYVRTLPNVEKVSIYSQASSVSAFKDGERISLYLKRTDGEFWQILEFKFLEGGPFTPEDEKNANPVAVINEATHKRFFGKDSAIGHTIEVDGQRFKVAGVVPNIPFVRQVPFADIWVPISTSKSDAFRHELMGGFQAMILARTRSDLPAIREEFHSRLAQVELPDPKNYTKFEGAAETMFESVARDMFNFGLEEGRAAALFGLMLAVAILFMILPTINLVNLNVSRILERASEIGVRKAFGASRRTLVGQFVIENIVLSLVGGALGLIMSVVVLRIIAASDLIPYAEFHLNFRIFLYGLALAVFFGLMSGVFPAWKMSRLNPVDALRGRAR